jgi:hypothetical protein
MMRVNDHDSLSYCKCRDQNRTCLKGPETSIYEICFSLKFQKVFTLADAKNKVSRKGIPPENILSDYNSEHIS